MHVRKPHLDRGAAGCGSHSRGSRIRPSAVLNVVGGPKGLLERAGQFAVSKLERLPELVEGAGCSRRGAARLMKKLQTRRLVLQRQGKGDGEVLLVARLVPEQLDRRNASQQRVVEVVRKDVAHHDVWKGIETQLGAGDGCANVWPQKGFRLT